MWRRWGNQDDNGKKQYEYIKCRIRNEINKGNAELTKHTNKKGNEKRKEYYAKLKSAIKLCDCETCNYSSRNENEIRNMSYTNATGKNMISQNEEKLEIRQFEQIRRS